MRQRWSNRETLRTNTSIYCTHGYKRMDSFWRWKGRTRRAKNTSAPRITHFQTSESSAVKLFEQPWVKLSQENLITVWFRSSNSAYRPLLSVKFLIYSNTCSHCGTETRGLLYPRQKRLRDSGRFAHCLACHGRLDYCPRLDELSADTMYVAEGVAPDPGDSLHVWQSEAVEW